MIIVLRLGHRKERDKRISTHVGLVARAFGAEGIVYAGEKDSKMIIGLDKVRHDFGGFFSIKYCANWKEVIKNAKDHGFTVVHLTAYGQPVQKKVKEVRKFQKLLVIVGSEKVPKEVYKMSDFNIAVSNQPHSEVAALSVFLHMFNKGKQFNKKFDKAQKEIIPQDFGKKVEKKD